MGWTEFIKHGDDASLGEAATQDESSNLSRQTGEMV